MKRQRSMSEDDGADDDVGGGSGDGVVVVLVSHEFEARLEHLGRCARARQSFEAAHVTVDRLELTIQACVAALLAGTMPAAGAARAAWLDVLAWAVTNVGIAVSVASNGSLAAVTQFMVRPLLFSVRAYGAQQAAEIAAVTGAVQALVRTLQRAHDTTPSAAHALRAVHTLFATPAAEASTPEALIDACVSAAQTLVVDGAIGGGGDEGVVDMQAALVALLDCTRWLCMPAETRSHRGCAQCAVEEGDDGDGDAAGVVGSNSSEVAQAAVRSGVVRLCMDMLAVSAQPWLTANIGLAAARLLHTLMAQPCGWARPADTASDVTAALNLTLAQVWTRSQAHSGAASVWRTRWASPSERVRPVAAAAPLPRPADAAMVAVLCQALCGLLARGGLAPLDCADTAADAWQRLLWLVIECALPVRGMDVQSVSDMQVAGLHMLHHRLGLGRHFAEVRHGNKAAWSSPRMLVAQHAEGVADTVTAWTTTPWLPQVWLLLQVVLHCHTPAVMQAPPSDKHAKRSARRSHDDALVCAVRAVSAALVLLCEVVACLSALPEQHLLEGEQVVPMVRRSLELAGTAFKLATSRFVVVHVQVVRLLATVTHAARTQAQVAKLHKATLPDLASTVQVLKALSLSKSQSADTVLQAAHAQSKALLADVV